MFEHDHPPEDLAPLRVSAASPEAEPADHWLAQGFAEMRARREESAEAADPDAGWAALQADTRRIARRHRRRYLSRELFALALPRRLPGMAAAALLLLMVLPQRGDRATTSSVELIPLLDTARFELNAPQRSRAARLLNGTVLEIEQGAAHVEQRDRAQTQVSLHGGALRLRVPRLPDRGQMTVLTEEAEVIVHGTRFVVQKTSGDATRVTVEEGLVEVRPRGGARPPAFLRPGEETTVVSLARYRAEIAGRVERLIEAARCDDKERVIDTHVSLAPEGSDLSAVHYLKGFCAARRGDHDEALRWFEQAAEFSKDLVRADNAMARAAQLRAVKSEGEGAAAWRRYVARFPAGLHRDSARRALEIYSEREEAR